MRIGLAFSGGGVRATVFHLGVLARLAQTQQLRNVRTLSTVSGGSLAAGLVFAANDYRWPNEREYLDRVVPVVHDLLTSRDLQRSYVMASICRPWRLVRGRARVLGDQIRQHWNIHARLSDLPLSPRWIINATCFETGKNFRFQRDSMGDYQTKYVQRPDFPLAHALASSAAVPGLIGPLVLQSNRHDWQKRTPDGWQPIDPRYKRLHLWDGGVYDNLGVESLFKPGAGLREGTDFLVVSDASRPLSADRERSRWKPGYLEASMRLVDVATDQVRSLRARMLIDHFTQNPGCGVYLRMGLDTMKPDRRARATLPPTLTNQQIKETANLETTLRRVSQGEFSRLFRHGCEVADATMGRHGSGRAIRRQSMSTATVGATG